MFAYLREGPSLSITKLTLNEPAIIFLTGSIAFVIVVYVGSGSGTNYIF